IKRLDDATVRRITAEQAISDLASIVKELIDNSLDAESTTIKIRLFGQGLDIIEVSDDGNGVPIDSRPYMATRHATSKIECIQDIYTGTGLTMGFRGEALFAMSCVSDSIVVASRTEDDDLATKLIFDNHKNKNSSSSSTRKVGTTVAVVKPFGNLPARRADITRRIRQERTKIFKLVESYGIFNVGVCFRLMDI
ncbi:ATPase domain of HSP90 chaperone/DNA topoisomerase II/histidine kinase, partial [Fragilariopsis cylindrus CCMP1102]